MTNVIDIQQLALCVISVPVLTLLVIWFSHNCDFCFSILYLYSMRQRTLLPHRVLIVSLVWATSSWDRNKVYSVLVLLKLELKKRTIYPSNRAIYPGKRAIYPGRRAVYSGKRAICPSQRAIYPRGKRATVFILGIKRAIYPVKKAIYPSRELFILAR